jgi:uncharacterized protein YegP (UPF0339 family)
MAEKIVVTDAQVKAAQMIVDRDRATGRETDEATRKIAEAKPEPMAGDTSRATGEARSEDVVYKWGPSVTPHTDVGLVRPQPAPERTTDRTLGSGGRFVLKKGKTGKFQFNLIAGNGQIIATSGAYDTREEALESIKSVETSTSSQIEVEDSPGQ